LPILKYARKKTMSGSVGFSYRVSFPEFKADKFIGAVKKSCNEALIKAARKFLLAALPHVPIFTGFARGAFGNLEDAVGRFTPGGEKTGASIEGQRGGFTAARNFARRPYYYYPKKGERVLRNTVTGRQFSTPSDQIFSKGKAVVAEGETVIFFRFSIDISYVNYLDRNKWGAFKAGQVAFDAELRQQLSNLPKVGKFLVKKDIKK
jgi:hypothetical protein